MPITEAQFKAAVISKVRDIAGGPVQTNINLIWDMYEDKDAIAPLLRFHYSVKEAIEWMIGGSHEKVNFMTDRVSVYNSDQLKYWHELYGATLLEIKRIETAYSSTGGGVIGTLTTETPINSATDPATSGAVEAGHRRYRGDPYYPMNRNMRNIR